MKASELIEYLGRVAKEQPDTWDTVKAGNPDKELTRLAVAMFPTAQVIRSAKEWGADMLLVHEPTYFEGDDFVKTETSVTLAKRRLVEQSGMIIFRYHDHMHDAECDLITEGELHYLGITGKIERTPYYASYIMTVDEPTSALDMAKRIEMRLGVKHVRIAGERDKAARRIALCFGMPGGVFELLRDESVDMVLVGEACSCDWQIAEYARDAAALGINKSLIVIGHVGSERDGMRLLASRLSEKFCEFETKYFECGEPYSYTD